MAKSEEFRELLAEAIHRISMCETNKPISVIHDELGHALGKPGAGTAIAYWRKGNLPQVPDLENLAREIVRRSDLGRAWLTRFLVSARYPYPENLCNELLPPPEVAGILTTVAISRNQLPFTKAYIELAGRDSLVNTTLAVLNDVHARAIVTIDGVGGIGKTALAQEIALICHKKKLFDNVVWLSAAKGNFQSIGIPPALTLDAVLNAIGHQLGVDDITQLPAIEKEMRIQALLRRHRVLIVLDNLETAAEAQTEIVRRLQPMLGSSKALLTSRQRFLGDLYTIHLDGLPTVSAQKFLHQEALARNISAVATSSITEVERIVQITGGSPLAMKLVVGQLSYLSIEVVLNHLQRVKPLTDRMDEDEYLSLYKYIYLSSWSLLSAAAKDLLVTMTPFVPGLGGTLSAIQSISNRQGDELPGYIYELWRFSFLEVGEVVQGSLAEKRYHLHALTKHFVLSDIVNWAN